jgi:hypothetical protein
VLQVNADELPETDFSDPDWVATFSRKLKNTLGVRLETIPRDRLPAHGMWIGIVDPGGNVDSDALHALVCRDQFVVHDPARRAPAHNRITDYRLFTGVRVREPGSRCSNPAWSVAHRPTAHAAPNTAATDTP